MSDWPVIVIVGAGYSGTATAIHLLRGPLPAGTRVVLLERPGHGIGGVAYDAPSEALLLNVPAGRMSAFEDAPQDFLEFLRREDPTADEASFARRRAFGRYLAARLGQAASAPRAAARLELAAADVFEVDWQAGRWRVSGEAGGVALAFDADAVVLATGNSAAAPPAWATRWMLEENRYADAWSPDSAAATSGAGPIVAIGTGLTFVDLVIRLRDNGYGGPIVGVSRHGELPCTDRGTPAAPTPDDLPAEFASLPPGRLRIRPFVAAVRRHARRLSAAGADYRPLLTALRPATAAVWARLDDRERSRFLRHALHLWNIHRHRMPAALAARMDGERAGGMLTLAAGRLAAVGRSATGLTVTLRARGGGTEVLPAARVVNCTGAPAGAPFGRPLDRLVARGHACRDGLGLGVLTDDDGRLYDRQRATGSLFYAGPLWRAQDFEMTAVPELRRRLPVVAAAVARTVVRNRRLA